MPEQVAANRRCGAFIHYADLAALMVMLGINSGGGVMDAVNEAQKLVRPRLRVVGNEAVVFESNGMGLSLAHEASDLARPRAPPAGHLFGKFLRVFNETHQITPALRDNAEFSVKFRHHRRVSWAQRGANSRSSRQ
jgi:hypothetical protein